ncbi:plasmid mobilization protein [Actinomadura formosensis]|uniref:plasmid mobilization protein n=1 Tax=Actinomadura formosensis TaxID=60706 RepID=UPI0008307882|nr:ribbon-helix-helix protein, CopG family [Actinomadura formosensis]
MAEKNEVKSFRGMTSAEEAEYHRANADRYAEYMETAEPVQLDRVVSTRFASDELEQVKAAAKAAGVSVSELIRRATVAYLAPAGRDAADREPAVPASAVIDLLGDYGVTVSEVEVTSRRRRRGKLSEIRNWAQRNHVVLKETDGTETGGFEGGKAADA